MQAIMAVVYREYLIRLTSLLWLFFDMMVPLLYMLLFGVGFNKALPLGIVIEGQSLSYNEFFLSGVLAMSCFGSAINQSYGFFLDRDNGIFYEFLTYPMTRAQLLLGKIVFQCLMSIVQTALALAAAVYLLDVSIRAEFVSLVFLAVIIGIAGWFFCLAIFAFLIRRNDVFNTVINAAYFVLIFLSSMFYPLDMAPSWLKFSSYANPLTWHTDVLRFLTIGIGDPVVVAAEGLAFLGFLLLSFWIAVKAIRQSV
ncbi:MAG TPA: ABC transporter permease [Bacteroidota bacterium]|nr:ABC transporter permease [Bacteroidota bacterium]